MAAQTRPRIKGHVAERFGLRRVDHFPNINAHLVEDDFEFVDHRDVHRAKNVLDEFGRFRRARGADLNHRQSGRHIKRAGLFSAFRRESAHHFRNVGGLELGVARVFAFG